MLAKICAPPRERAVRYDVVVAASHQAQRLDRRHRTFRLCMNHLDAEVEVLKRPIRVITEYERYRPVQTLRDSMRSARVVPRIQRTMYFGDARIIDIITSPDVHGNYFPSFQAMHQRPPVA